MSRRLAVVTTVASAALIMSAYALQRTTISAQAKPIDEHSAHMQPVDLAAAWADVGPQIPLQQQDLTLPASNAGAEARLAASPRHGEWVKFPMSAGSPDTVMAWIVYPKSNAKAPVVVVVHENTGLITWVRSVADQVAAEGFIAIAPDFLSRVRGGPSTEMLARDSVGKILPGVTMAERVRIVSAAANYAMMQPAATQKYAVIGYCWGGSTVWGHAVNGGVNGFSGGVAFYGSPFMTGGLPATATTPAVAASVNADSLAKIKAPVMLLNGSKDARIGANMPTVDSIMKAMKKSYTGMNYEGAVHGFLRAQNDPKATRDEVEEAANLAAAKDGWPRTVAFLKKNLGVK